MKKRFYIWLIFVLNFNYFSNAQDILDSLITVLKKEKSDTSKIRILNDLAYEFKGFNPDTSILLSNQALALSKKLSENRSEVISNYAKKAAAQSEHLLGTFYSIIGEFTVSLNHYDKALVIWEQIAASKNEKFSADGKRGKATTYGNVGNIYSFRGDFIKALHSYFDALKISEELNLKKDIARHLGNIGNVYVYQGNYTKALDYLFKSLKINEELKNKNISTTLGNIGNVYSYEGDYEKALDYYTRSLKLNEEMGNKDGMCTNLDNIGNIYSLKGEFTKALDCFNRVLKMTETMADKSDMITSFGNIGSIYLYKGDSALAKGNRQAALGTFFPKAAEYYLQALELANAKGNKRSVSINEANLGNVYKKVGKFKESEDYLKKAFIHAEETQSLEQIKEIEMAMSSLYDTLRKPALAFAHYKKYIAARDTINSADNQKKQVRTEMNYEFDKKEAALIAEQNKKDAIAAEEKQQQKIITYSVSAGLLMVLLLSLFIFRGYKQKQKANSLLAEKNNIIEEKNKDILDSIRYAKRIQTSLLPTEKYIDRIMKRGK